MKQHYRTKVAAIGYLALYASMLWMYATCADVAKSGLLILIQPVIIASVLYGISIVDSDKRNIFSWMIAYFCIVMGLMLIMSAS